MTRNMNHLWARTHDTLEVVRGRYLLCDRELLLRFPDALQDLVELLIDIQRLIEVDKYFPIPRTRLLNL